MKNTWKLGTADHRQSPDTHPLKDLPRKLLADRLELRRTLITAVSLVAGVWLILLQFLGR